MVDEKSSQIINTHCFYTKDVDHTSGDVAHCAGEVDQAGTGHPELTRFVW